MLISCRELVSAELSFDEENAYENRGQVSWYCLSVSLECGLDKQEVIVMANECYWIRNESVLVSF